MHVGKERRTHAFSCCLSSFGGIDKSNIATFWVSVTVGCPCLKIESSEVENEAMDCRLGEWRGMMAMKKDMSLISKDF